MSNDSKSKQKQKSKNDEAWEKIFDEFDVLSCIERDGKYEISSETINRFRESRLMAKIDHKSSLPAIFKENGLCILPVSRGSYTIGKFNAYYPVKYNYGEHNVEYFDFPALETLQCSELDSEALALLIAYNAGLIERLLGDQYQLTLMGRMSTGEFSFRIQDTRSTVDCFDLNVKNSQCEIDGGFEGSDKLILLEVKNYTVDDFVVRQLYYPYRCWISRVSKEVIPIFMTFSGGVFSFFVYEFSDPNAYDSIALKSQKHYIAGSEFIESDDVMALLKGDTKPEVPNAPFPQADKIERLLDLLQLLHGKEGMNQEEIADSYQFNLRQSDYYANAGIYLGLIQRDLSPSSPPGYFSLTAEGVHIMSLPRKGKVLGLIEKILEHKPFKDVFLSCQEHVCLIKKKEITEIMYSCQLSISGETVRRRAGTVRSWINWILRQY